ncbi:MAG: Enoyl-CoA hydratase/isomerase, partial [Solirubrobacterales bacterium]|nr:Enoyl-CoA hydratase/isomerase [Solirubrobacterales bacterium]
MHVEAAATAGLDVRCEDGVATVVLDRPDRLNALDQALFDGLPLVLRALAASPDVRVVVLAGAGRAFCAGADVGDADGFGDEPSARAWMAAAHEGAL